MHSLTVHLHDTEFIDIWLIVFGRIHVSVCVRLCLAASVSSSLCLAVSDVVCVCVVSGQQTTVVTGLGLFVGRFSVLSHLSSSRTVVQ